MISSTMETGEIYAEAGDEMTEEIIEELAMPGYDELSCWISMTSTSGPTSATH